MKWEMDTSINAPPIFVLVPVREGLWTQLLAGAPDRSPLWRGDYKRTVHENFTSIDRNQFLAGRHPSVQSVGIQKDNATDPAELNEIGRARKYHQSRHDLELVIAASGAPMRVGVTVNAVSADCMAGLVWGLLSLWWAPAKGGTFTEKMHLLAQSIFFDNTETMHLMPEGLPIGRA